MFVILTLTSWLLALLQFAVTRDTTTVENKHQFPADKSSSLASDAKSGYDVIVARQQHTDTPNYIPDPETTETIRKSPLVDKNSALQWT